MVLPLQVALVVVVVGHSLMLLSLLAPPVAFSDSVEGRPAKEVALVQPSPTLLQAWKQDQVLKAVPVAVMLFQAPQVELCIEDRLVSGQRSPWLPSRLAKQLAVLLLEVREPEGRLQDVVEEAFPCDSHIVHSMLVSEP